ncbi:hypothetical protein PLANPX_5313 [Lacipirellula parvula]|uniref:Uncharacterized protein n=1 Tax=Lacipirellula parvula TaxID=2650471 RepID=A0A5K7XKJ9_9BACT|nr:hypothetical protein PLANPX_5313 [Lacipirellula parvula]
MNAKTDTNVAHRIEQLLARVAGVRRGTECDRPVKFDRRGQAHAQQVAEAERTANARSISPRNREG